MSDYLLLDPSVSLERPSTPVAAETSTQGNETAVIDLTGTPSTVNDGVTQTFIDLTNTPSTVDNETMALIDLTKTPSTAGGLKRFLPTSSPISTPTPYGSKRLRTQNFHIGEGDVFAENLGPNDTMDHSMRQAISAAKTTIAALSGGFLENSDEAEEISSDQGYVGRASSEVFADSDRSIWDLHYTSDAAQALARPFGSESNFEIKIESLSFRRGQTQHLNIPRHGIFDVPTIVCTNEKTGKFHNLLVDVELFSYKRVLYGYDEQLGLWRETNIYIGDFFDRCVDVSPDPKEYFPILHRLGKHLAIAGDPAVAEDGVSTHITDVVAAEWKRLIVRYGSFNDIQIEQRAVLDKAFGTLSRYQKAIASRDISESMKLTDSLGPLQEALNALWIDEYVIREMFYINGAPKFIVATR